MGEQYHECNRSYILTKPSLTIKVKTYYIIYPSVKVIANFLAWKHRDLFGNTWVQYGCYVF